MRDSSFLDKLCELSEKYDSLAEQFEKSGDFDIFTDLVNSIEETRKDADDSTYLDDEDRYEIISETTLLLSFIKGMKRSVV